MFCELSYHCVIWIYKLYENIIFVRRYKAGSTIDVIVRLTASHMGYFEFNLCPLKTEKELETDKCFDQHYLLLADGSGHKFSINTYGAKDYIVRLVLPKDVTCKHCVLRLELKEYVI